MRVQNTTPDKPYLNDAIHKLYDARDRLRILRGAARRPAGLRSMLTGDLFDELGEIDDLIVEAQQLLFNQSDLKEAEGRRKRRLPRR